MLLIIAHHYVVNSGLIGILKEEPLNLSSSLMLLFGAWGKTGINCFVLITGYFMSKSSFSGDKLLKLYLQITFYALIIYGIFCISGQEHLSLHNILWQLWPAKSIADGFTSCFLLFYLFIPFLNIFIKALDRKNHIILLILLCSVFSLLPSVPVIRMTFNYVGWFMVLYLVGAYIRLYGFGKKIKHCVWGWLTLILVSVASCSILGMTYFYKWKFIPVFVPYFFISDSNKILALAIAVTSFMYFKDLKIPHSRLINVLGAATFGVFLIHTRGDVMRHWLWRDTVDCVGNYSEDVILTFGYACGCVLMIFIVCAGIDWFRGKLIEPWMTAGAKRLLYPIRKRISGYRLCH